MQEKTELQRKEQIIKRLRKQVLQLQHELSAERLVILDLLEKQGIFNTNHYKSRRD